MHSRSSMPCCCAIPFGQEGIRAHRLYRVMSDRLAAAGYHVLRFDYYGSGDSAGSDEEWDVQGSIADAQAALAELLRRSRAPRWSAVGLRWAAPSPWKWRAWRPHRRSC
jgi:hypothetical protein